MCDSIPQDWTITTVRDLVDRHFCGPSPDCEERPIFANEEWGVLKTTAITWSGWDERAHKVLPKAYWGQIDIEVHAGDILVTKAGPRHRVGVVCHVPKTRNQLLVSGKMIGLRPKTAIIVPSVLAGLIARRQPQKYIHDRTTGMAESQVNFANEVLLNTPLSVPPLREQRKMGMICKALDTAIHETETIIAKLQLVNQGLLHDLLTRGVDANGELRPPMIEAAHLYKESSIGWIPKEWEQGELRDWLSGKPKNVYSPQEAGGWTGRLMLGLGCLTINGFAPIQLKNAPLHDRGVDGALLSDGDLLISRANTRELVGLVGVYRNTGHPCSYPDLMMRLTPASTTSAEFLEIVLGTPSSRKQIQAAASGTSASMVKISSSIVCSMKVAIPKAPEQKLILAVIARMKVQLLAERNELSGLKQIQQGLMDDILTGRVRVTPLLEGGTHQ